jgi:hypothetical protein
MDGDVLRLEPPAEEEREWLLDGLATLIRRHGYERLISCRILLPTDEDFPDEVPSGASGVRVLLLRLLWYAGMGQHRARLTVYEERTFMEVDHRGVGHGGAGTAAWFAGIEGEICEFGVNAGELRLEREEVIGTLGHEVAHAFRYHHQLCVRDAEVEERLTDLTAVYLGFGTFLLNSSASFKTGGVSASGERLLYEKRERGYLSPAQLAFLLATQVVVRGTGPRRLRAIADTLSANQRKLFDASCELLPATAELRERLCIPEPEQWPAWPERTPRPQDLQLEPTAEEAKDEADEAEQPLANAGPSGVISWDPPGPPVRRVEGSYAGLLGLGGSVAPWIVGAMGALEGLPLIASSLLGGVVGVVIGRRLPSDSCSACRARLPRGAERCERCHGTVVRGAPPDPFADEDDDSDDATTESGEEIEQIEPSMQLLCAMYAAWAIERRHLTAELEAEHADLIADVHCGNYPSERLWLAWSSVGAGLEEEAAEFFQRYCEGPERHGALDYERLTQGGALLDTRAGYQRVSALLDARFAAWRAA